MLLSKAYAVCERVNPYVWKTFINQLFLRCSRNPVAHTYLKSSSEWNCV